MSYHYIEYNSFYYSNLCHVCKESNQNLKRCSLCRTVAYCSKDHQKQDWKIHKDICRAIAKTNANSSLNLIHNFEDFKKSNILKSLLWQKELCRSLFNFECQMWMFPRVCALCFSKNITVDCSNCLNVSYCSAVHKALHKVKHSKFCDALKLAMAIDLYNFHKKGKPSSINVCEFDQELISLPNNLQDLMIMYGKEYCGKGSIPDQNDSDQLIQFIIKSDFVAPAATILYGMEKSGLLKDRLFRKSDLVVHIVGAELTEMGWLWKLITELPFHWIKNLRSLDFFLIGPQLNHNGVTKKFADQLCDSCKEKHPRTRIIFHWKLYHEVIDSLDKPDIVVAFNSGLHVCDDDSWSESIDCLTMYPDVPLVLTAYTLDEITLDLHAVKSKTKKKIDVILEPQKNPFSYMTPIRDWETENTPVFYVNEYITIVKAA